MRFDKEQILKLHQIGEELYPERFKTPEMQKMKVSMQEKAESDDTYREFPTKDHFANTKLVKALVERNIPGLYSDFSCAYCGAEAPEISFRENKKAACRACATTLSTSVGFSGASGTMIYVVPEDAQVPSKMLLSTEPPAKDGFKYCKLPK